ncbi:transporter substrate-binding domain-containing protein, partial [Pseudomonas aeruginosa]
MQRLQAVLLLCLACCWPGLAGALTLTPEERAWLAEHPSIRLGVDTSWPPFEYRDEQGRYQGLAAGYIGLLQERLGVSLTPVEPKTWTQVLEQAKDGRLDLLPGIMATPERQEYLSFTRPYLDFPIIILARKNGPMPKR